MKSRTSSRRSAGLLVATCLLGLLAAGCSTPTAKPSAPRIFYPPAPELPRIQYLTSFTGRKDVEEQSSFDRFVVGEKQNLAVDKPYGVAISKGKIYVCDTNGTVAVFDLVGKSFGALRGATGPGSLVQPLNVSVDPLGRKYVTDPGRGQVLRFGPDDEFDRAYGRPGGWRPVDAVPFEERLYVADSEKGLVHVFDLESGDELRTIGADGDPAERLDRPTNLAFDASGHLFVTDVSRFQVVRFDRDGHFLSTVGRLGDNFGHFARPKGIAVDPAGRLLAVDASFGNVQIFDPSGRLLMFFGGGDGPDALRLPAKISVDTENVPLFERYAAPGFRIEALLLVTNQFGEHRVNVYGFGHQEGKHYPTDAELLRQIDEQRRLALEKAAAAPPAAEPKSEDPGGKRE